MEVKKEGDQVETCPNPLRGAQSWGWSTQRYWGTMGNTKTGLDGANGGIPKQVPAGCLCLIL